MVIKKRGLGKGLSALIPDNPISDILEMDSETDSISNIDIELINPNEDQPRKAFNKDSLEDLASSIKVHGIIQPIVVRRLGKSYQIIAGERRWRAAKTAGLKQIPAIIREVDQIESMKLALIENIQREDLNPIEEAHAFKGLMEGYELTQEEVAEAVGKSRSYVANSIRLLKLDNEVQDYIIRGKISSGHGRALLGIDDEKERKKLADSIVDKNINVRDTERMTKGSKKPKAKSNKKDPMVQEIEDNLMRTLGTKVKLNIKKSGGKIEIEFYDYEDLERVTQLIMD